MSQATAERRKLIMSQLLEQRQVTVKDLAAAMEVSDATVRRDLKALADEQGLKLVHGGAALPRERDFSYQARLLRSSQEKKVIGSLASKLMRDGEHVFLDSGTTCSELVPYVKQMHDVTILTNSARLALELDASGVQLYLIGGEYRPDRMDTIGPLAVSTLNQVRGYTAFIGADGLSMDFGPSAMRSGQRASPPAGCGQRSFHGAVGRPQQVRQRLAVSNRRLAADRHRGHRPGARRPVARVLRREKHFRRLPRLKRARR